MQFNKKDQIEFKENMVFHQSAGGFVFYEDKNTHILYVALLKKDNGNYLIPKGHIQQNEDEKNAALREIKEELNFEGNLEQISKIGIDNYSFKLQNDNREHYKNVHLYVYNSPKKEKINPLEKEVFVIAEWLEFYDALEKITFDKDNLLKARQFFYYNKKVKNFISIKDVNSIFVGIPTRDGAKTIILTLKSIFRALNKLPNHITKELTICLDHCQDNTEEVIKNFLKERKDLDFKISLIKNYREPGKTNSLNLLFKESNADLLCFVDDDIELEESCILNLVKEIIRDKKIRCVYARWVRKKLKTINPIHKFWHWSLGVKFDVQPYKKSSEFMRGSCMMFRSENFVYLPKIIF